MNSHKHRNYYYESCYFLKQTARETLEIAGGASELGESRQRRIVWQRTPREGRDSWQLPIRVAEDVDVSVRSAVYPVISVCFSDHRVDVVGVLNFLDYQPCHPTIRKSPPRSV